MENPAKEWKYVRILESTINYYKATNCVFKYIKIWVITKKDIEGIA